MTMKDGLVGAGVGPEKAKVLAEYTIYNAPTKTVGTGISAAGSAITDATDLTKFINVISSAAASTGVQLPSQWPVGVFGIVQNNGANALSIYPHSASGTINGGSAGAAVTTAAAAGALVVRASSTDWLVYVLAKEA